MIQLNSDQEFVVQHAVDWYFNSPEQIFQYDGPPGSGKSVVLNEIVRRIGLDVASEVAPMSFIGAASLIMRKNGLFTARTAHSWIYELVEVPRRDIHGNVMYRDNGTIIMDRQFRPRHFLDPNIKLIIVDEAYCMPRSMRPTLQNYGIKILACGDSHQLPPVNDAPAFLVDGKVYHLTQIMRQAGRDDIIFLANRAMEGMSLPSGFYGNSLVIEREDLTDDMMLWADAVICGTNNTRDAINRHIRYLRGHKSLLPEYGEKVVCRNNNWDIEAITDDGNTMNLVNGLIGTVVNQPSIETYDPYKHTFNLSFRCESAKCMFNCNASYEYMIAGHNDRMMFKDMSNRSIHGQFFEFAYAITCHIAQGSQFDNVIYIEETLGKDLQPALNLVGATRAVKHLIYVNNNHHRFNQFTVDPNEAQYIASSQKRIQHIINKKENEWRKSHKSAYSLSNNVELKKQIKDATFSRMGWIYSDNHSPVPRNVQDHPMVKTK